MMRMIALIRAATTTMTLLVGVPVLLVALGGNPLPQHLPSGSQVQAWLDDPLMPGYVPGTARVVAWLVWALLAALILTAGTVRARRWRWGHLAAFLPGPVQGLAATLLGAATVTTAVGIPPAHAAAPATTSDTATPGHTNTTNAESSALPGTADHHDGHRARTLPVVTVHRGDTLWNIAGAQLGNPHRWKQIYRLNTSRHPSMRGGAHIEPGWTLTLPTSNPLPGHRPPRPGTTARHAPPTAPTPAGGNCSPTPAPGTAATPAPPAIPPAEPPGTPANGHRDTGHRRQPGSGIALPGGSWIDLGLATAITAAAALIWAHRRRRYSRHPLSVDLRLNNPDLAPLPPVVDQIRRRLRRAANDTTHATGAASTPAQALPIGAPVGSGEHTDPDERIGHFDPGGSHDDRDDQPPATTHDSTGEQVLHERINTGLLPRPGSVGPALAYSLGMLWAPAGLGLVGSGAHAAARGLLTTALAIDAPEQRSQVVIPAPVAAALLGTGAATVPHTPWLTITGGLDEALNLLEAHILHRSRILDSYEVDTMTKLRSADPAEELMPPMMLLAGATTGHQRTRIAALLTQGQHLDIHGVLIGAWPDGNTIEVATDGTTTPVNGQGPHPGSHPADVGRLTVLSPAETYDLLRTLAESHTGQQQSLALISLSTGTANDGDTTQQATTGAGGTEPNTTVTAPASPTAASSPTASSNGAAADDGGQHVDQPTFVTNAHPGQDRPRPTSVTSRPLSAPAETVGSGPVGAVPASEHSDGQPHTKNDETLDADMSGTGRAQITVLGPVSILGLPAGVTPRKKSLELLVYLAVHDGQATAEAILDDVLGDVPASKAPGRFYTYVSDLRAVLRRTAGPGTYLSHPGQRYVLNRELVDVDLWRMQDAIRDAGQLTLTTDAAERQAALRRAVNAYSGSLAEGADYDWIEPYREAVRQQSLDAHMALAEMLADSPAEQITVLDAAIGHNPYAEQLYQQAMIIRAGLGHLDAIRTLRRALTRALADIDAEPADETTALADQLVARLHRTSRRDLRRAPAAGEGATL